MSVKTNLGRVGLVPRGEYDGESSYRRLDFVVYGGSSYVALRDAQGVAPDAEHVYPAQKAVWAMLAERGNDGDDGISPEFTFSAQTGEPGSQVRLEQSGTPQAPSIRLTIPRGADGVTPAITVTAQTGEPGSGVRVQQGGTSEAPTLHFIIPAGEQGPAGRTEGVPYSDRAPAPLGEASPGVSEEVARADHVHEMPTAEDVGARPDTWTPTAEDVGARPDTWTPTARDVGAVSSVNGQTPDESGNVTVESVASFTVNGHTLDAQNQTADLTAEDVGARPDTWTPTAEDVGALPADTAIPTINGSTDANVTFSLSGTVLTITVS